MGSYKVAAAHKGHSFELITDAPTGAKAVVGARRMAKALGFARITVNAVELIHYGSLEDYAPYLTYPRYHSMTLGEINDEVGRVLGEAPLRAYTEGGRTLLGDGINNAVAVEHITQTELIDLLYDWAVFAGYTNEDFKDFLALL